MTSAGWRPSRASLNEVRPRRPEQVASSTLPIVPPIVVSMKSGLEGRNKLIDATAINLRNEVSMKSGLEGRNNIRSAAPGVWPEVQGLNEVRPRRPEQVLVGGSISPDYDASQ